MARFDYYESPGGAGYLLDVQADLMSGLATRIVVPLLPVEEAPRPAGRLNPVFAVGEGRFAMVTQFMAAVPLAVLKNRSGSLANERDAIANALDMIFSGF